MRAPGVKFGFHKCKIVEPEPQAPVGACLAAFAAASGHAGAAFRVARDGQLDCSRLAIKISVQQRNVGLLDAALAKIVDELFVGGVGQRDDDQAGRSFVETVNDAWAEAGRPASRAFPRRQSDGAARQPECRSPRRLRDERSFRQAC